MHKFEEIRKQTKKQTNKLTPQMLQFLEKIDLSKQNRVGFRCANRLGIQCTPLKKIANELTVGTDNTISGEI